MSHPYLPEGRLLNTPENIAACRSHSSLTQAMEQNTILEGTTLLCTQEHDLMVAFGGFTGRVPREEAALGIREGTVREISILSRVGNPTMFTITGMQDGQFLLSRRKAQERALHHLMNLPTGTILPATVTRLERYGAFVDIGCGIPSLLHIDRCSVSRISHTACRFSPGQNIFVLLTGHDQTKGWLHLSHKELLGTWRENTALFSPGMTVTGIVRGIKPYGIFVELTPNLAGLADPADGFSENDRISVYIRAILPEKHKIKLNLLQRLEQKTAPEPLSYFITEGQVTGWTYED